MKINIIKILIPFILCCFTYSFLELDFCGQCQQTWHDEYDTYAVGSNASRTERLPTIHLDLDDPVLPATDLAFPVPGLFVFNIPAPHLSIHNYIKAYIRNGALLI